jgi:hypothetical protein
MLPALSAIVTFCLVSALPPAQAQFAAPQHAGWFPFVVPDLAGPETEACAVDLSYLNPEPAGTHGFLRPRGEELVDDRGVPVRLFGSNITDYHPMPPKDIAPRVARRLQQLGMNFIRLHYYDWTTAPDGILNPDRQTLNAEKLDQFDFFISELKRCGIYVDINLHVARGYKDMPPGWDRMGKGLDIIHQPYIDSQKQYARDLLTHVNPYTGNAYVREPAVAVIELNNENTALQQSYLPRFAEMPPAFSEPLQARWNAYLKSRYASVDALRAAWNTDAPRGPNLIRNADLSAGTDGWTVQNSGEATSTLTVVTEEGAPFLRWEATRAGSQGWHLQLQQPSVPVEAGKRYVLTFRARADAPREISVSLMQQAEPWRTVGASFTVRLNARWQEYAVGWTINNPEGLPVRLNVSTNNTIGRFDLAGFALREGAVAGLAEGQSPWEGTVPLVQDTSCVPRARDYAEFMIGLELDYVRQMRALIKDELGAGSMVFDTQVSYGGLAGLLRAQLEDVVDCHTYPAHPARATDENGRQYLVTRNVSMLDGAYGGLERLAMWRVAGKPFFVTEFDLNPPNDHSAETFPMLALMAAYQGWAGIADYAWYNFQRTYGHDRITSHFADVGHPGQMIFVPTAALLFRTGLVAPAGGRTTLTVPQDGLADALVKGDWSSPASLFSSLGAARMVSWRLATAVQLGPGNGAPTVSLVPPGDDSRGGSDTGQISLDRSQPGQETLTVNAPAVRMLIGRVAGRSFRLGDVEVAVAPGTFRDYANLALVALDGKPIAESRKALLTVLARVENQGQRWNEDRSRADWGEGPTVAEPVSLDLTLPGDGWRGSALTGAGQRAGQVTVADGRFALGPQYKTLWYLFER